MADHTNPFCENYCEEKLEEVAEQGTAEFEINSTMDDELEQHAGIVKINSDSIAEYLLQKKYVLTALEFHMELLESGKELPRMRKFFSNPANFEQPGNGSFDTSNSLHRTGSISTFDSLDLMHSDDGTQQQDDRVAVLEFELRKANEMIRSLRMSLTGTLEENSFLKADGMNEGTEVREDQQADMSTGQDDAESNPLMKRALNYLVNEYLLQNGYKLASITLAEEIEDQDFEDWDDVGLNMPKPPNLVNLFHDYSAHNLPNHSSCDACVGTDCAEFGMNETLNSAKAECERLERENCELNNLITQLQKESIYLQENTLRSTPTKPSDSPVMEDKNGIKAETKSVVNFIQKRAKNQIASVSDRPSTSRMSTRFWDKLTLFWHDETSDNERLSNEVSRMASSPDDLVSTLSSSLPRVVSTVDPERRDELIPLILSTAAMQQDSNARNLLLHNLFNLIEKPERHQRQIILSGCVAYARVVGPSQTEEDLLPQFWEQIGHKYSERRHLVAEACGSIAPFLKSEMRSSLLLSILQQMQQEESVEKVREAIVRSLAVLFALLDDDDKYTQSFRIVCSCINDKSFLVQQAARKYLLLSFACWSKQAGKLCDHLFDHFLSNVEATVMDKEGSKLSDFNQSAFLDSLENLHVLLPCLFAEILVTMPQEYHSLESHVSFAPSVLFNDDLYHLSMLFEKEDDFIFLFEKFCGCISDADLEHWGSLLSLLCNFIPRILQIVRNIHPALNECVDALCEFFSSLVTLFGMEFVKSRLKEKRSELFYMEGEEDVNREISFENTPFTSAAVAVYGCGILAACADHETSDELNTFLHDTLVALATCHAPLTSLEVTLIEIRKKGIQFHEVILDVLWSGIAHPSAYVRAASASLFKVMATEGVSVKILTTRVLPALLTLSKDKEDSVQTATLPVFGSLLECSRAGEEIIDRVIAQLSAFMVPSGGSPPHHSMNVEIVKTMAEVTPKADPRFCNDFVLPHLAAIAAKNNQQSNKTKRSDIACEMLKAFTNVSFCYVPDSLLQSALIPGLRCLLQDMEKLHPEHVAKVEKLIKDMELKLEQRAPIAQPEVTVSLTAEKPKTGKSKFYNKLF